MVPYAFHHDSLAEWLRRALVMRVLGHCGSHDPLLPSVHTRLWEKGETVDIDAAKGRRVVLEARPGRRICVSEAGVK